MTIYLVLHHEIMGGPDNLRADEMVFYAASSLQKALNLIKRSQVDLWSWWEIQKQTLDRDECPEHVGYYGRRGGKLARQPYGKCKELYLTVGRDRWGPYLNPERG